MDCWVFGKELSRIILHAEINSSLENLHYISTAAVDKILVGGDQLRPSDYVELVDELLTEDSGHLHIRDGSFAFRAFLPSYTFCCAFDHVLQA